MNHLFLFILPIFGFFTTTDGGDTSVIPANKTEAGSEATTNALVADVKLVKDGDCQYLSFESWEAFEAKVDELDAAVEAADDSWLERHSDLTDEELEVLEDQENYDEEKPLADFEESLGFTNALRPVYNRTEMAWLNDVSGRTSDPDDIYEFEGEEASLLNDRQQVMVAGKLYFFTATGCYVIEDDFCEKSSHIFAHDKIMGGDETTKFYENTSPEAPPADRMVSGDLSCAAINCKWSDKTIAFTYYDNGNRRLKARLTHFGMPWFAKTTSTIRPHRKRSDGSWRRTRLNMCNRLVASWYAPDQNGVCTLVTGETKNKCRKWKRLKVTRRYWGYGIPLNVHRNGSTYGSYTGGPFTSSNPWLVLIAW